MARSIKSEQERYTRDSKLLGHSIGVATGRLRKSIIFEYARLSNLLDCYQCKAHIDSIDDFTIEHTIPWRAALNPASTFYDLSTIAFSHTRCNLGSYSREKTHCPQGHPYDDENTYHECTGERRCRECNKQRQKAAYKRRKKGSA